MVLIVYGNAGLGHKRAALAIQEEFLSRGLTESSEALDSLTFTSPLFSKAYPGVYQFAVTSIPKIWAFSFWLLDQKIFHDLDRLLKKTFPPTLLANFEKMLRSKNPRRLVFTHFLGLYNAVKLKKRGEISSSIHVVVTDFFAHAFWIHPEIDQYSVMSEETRADIVRRWGIPKEKIQVTGIPISRKFLGALPERKFRERITLLFTSGLFGVGPTENCLRSLFPLASKIEVIVVCGSNQELRERLSRIQFPYPIKILGFVTNMEEWMNASDLIIAKPGGITTSEALVKGLPMIIPSVIPGQEEGNLKLLEQYDACWRLKSPEDLFEVISDVVENPQILEEKRRNLSRLAKPNAAKDIVNSLL